MWKGLVASPRTVHETDAFALSGAIHTETKHSDPNTASILTSALCNIMARMLLRPHWGGGNGINSTKFYIAVLCYAEMNRASGEMAF